MNLRTSADLISAAAPLGCLLGALRTKGISGDLDAASLEGSGDYPRLAVISDIGKDEALEVMTAMGVHAPKLGAIGKGVDVLVMERGSVVRPHIEVSHGGPCTVTYLALHGNCRVLSWGCDLSSKIWGMSDYEINFLSNSTPTRSFNQANPHFRPLLYQILTDQAVTVRDGCFHLVVASSDAGTV